MMNFMFRLYIEYLFILGVAPPNSNEREMNEVEIDSDTTESESIVPFDMIFGIFYIA